jgi:FkbM family methyltransferase
MRRGSSMISYAQNFEDVMLYRALRGVGNGFYVDVGAWHPRQDSVTKWFYQIGWSGINIEPSKKYFTLLQRKRPRDINLNIAISRLPGKVNFRSIKGSASGSSAIGEAGDMDSPVSARASVYEVDAHPLSDVLSRYCGSRDIHFLKIDVEGHEHDVIERAGLDEHRPWIILVEAVDSEHQRPAWETWEPIILAADYRFVWFDGLNRFYLRNESIELERHFDVPPNLFDNFHIDKESSIQRLRRYGQYQLGRLRR